MGTAGRQGAPSPALHVAAGAGHHTHSRLVPLPPAPAGPLRKRTAHTHLCTVWEATRKDMRSPPVSCCPATREPPIKRVPKTMPARSQDRWSGRRLGDRVWPLCQSLPHSPMTGVSASHPNGLCLPSFGKEGDGATSLLPPQKLCPWLRYGPGPVCPLPA